MKKNLTFVLVLAMLFSLICNVPAFAESENNDIDTAAYEQLVDDIWDELKEQNSLGELNGEPVAYITLTADLIGDISQEDLAETEAKGVPVVVNQDGSITYTVTKDQHKEIIIGAVIGFEDSLAALITDETLQVTDIKHNIDYSVFELYVGTEEIGFNEAFLCLSFYIYGTMFAMFEGYDVADVNVTVLYYNANNELVEEWNSSEAF